MSLMLNEIGQQPQVLARTLDKAGPQLRSLIKRFKTERPTSIVLVARGTSDNAATFTRYLCEIMLGIPTSLAAPSVSTVYGRAVVQKGMLVVGISQSGESTDTNLYLESARAAGATTLGITNESKSTMARISDEVILVRAGRERSVAATKTYSGQLLAGYLLAQSLGAPITDSILARVPELVAAQLKLSDQVRDLAERYRYMEQAVVIGRGLNYSNALELALKLMETNYIVAERFSGADFAHGPIALVEKGFPVFAFAPGGPTHAGTSTLLKRLWDVGAETVAIGPKQVVSNLESTRQIALPGRFTVPKGLPEDLLTSIPMIVPGQLFAAHLADHKGLDADHPRMLSKVTKTI